MSLLSVIGELFKPAAKLIDDLHTSEEERLAVKTELFKAQAEMSAKVLDYEKTLMEKQAEIITAEAKGESWLQRNWRPGMMVWFGLLLGMYWFGLTPENLSQDTIDKLFSLLQIGIGGYIIGRSAEKTIPKVTEIMRKD